MGQTVLNIDIGSSNIKLTVFSYDGRVVRFDRTKTPYVKSKNEAFIEMDPNEVLKTVKALLKRSGKSEGEDVLAITVTGMAKSELLVDEKGEPISNSISWMDNRCHGICFDRLSEISSQLQHDPVSTSYLPFRNQWMKKNHAELMEKAACWVNITDFIQAKMAGNTQMTTDYSEACRSLVFNSYQEKWNEELLDFFGIEKRLLPQVLESGTYIGELEETFNLGKGIKVFKGGHDHMCAARAACLHQDGTILFSTGTSEMMVAPLDHPVEIKLDTMNIDHQVDPGKWAIVGSVARSGDSLNWANDVYGLYELEKKTDFVSHYIDCYKNLPIYIPAAIGSNPAQCGAFFNLTNRSSRTDLSISVIEGITLESVVVANKVKGVLSEAPARYRVVGGFTQLKDVLAFKAAALNAPLEVFTDVDMSSLGGFLISRKGLDSGTDINRLAEELLNNQTHFTVVPDRSLTDCLMERLPKYLEYRKAVVG